MCEPIWSDMTSVIVMNERQLASMVDQPLMADSTSLPVMIHAELVGLSKVQRPTKHIIGAEPFY